MTIYIDASEGFKEQGKAAGVAIVHENKYWAIPIQRCGNNQAEMTAFKIAVRQVSVRPLVVVTDSLHVVAYGKAKDVWVEWKKRNSTIEMEIADLLSKMAARNGLSMQGIWEERDVVTMKETINKSYVKHKKEKEYIPTCSDIINAGGSLG